MPVCCISPSSSSFFVFLCFLPVKFALSTSSGPSPAVPFLSSPKLFSIVTDSFAVRLSSIFARPFYRRFSLLLSDRETGPTVFLAKDLNRSVEDTHHGRLFSCFPSLYQSSLISSPRSLASLPGVVRWSSSWQRSRRSFRRLPLPVVLFVWRVCSRDETSAPLPLGREGLLLFCAPALCSSLSLSTRHVGDVLSTALAVLCLAFYSLLSFISQFGFSPSCPRCCSSSSSSC